MLHLKALNYLVVIAEEENLHRAADRLHVAQPALTRHVRLLEEELGFKLFLRKAQGLELTLAGQSYVNAARKILHLSAEAKKQASLIDRGFNGSVQIAFHDVAHHSRLFKAIFEDFTHGYRDVHLALRTMTSHEQLDALAQRKIDAGFVYLWKALPPSLTSFKLLDDEYQVVLPRGHRLETAPVVHLGDLASEPFIWVDARCNFAQSELLHAACDRAGFVPNIVHDGFSTSSAMISLASVGAGAAFLPVSLAANVGDQVTFRYVEGLDVKVELHIAYPVDQPHSALLRFLDCAERVTKQYYEMTARNE